MDSTLSHFVEPLKGTQGAAIAVALSVGLLLLTVLQHVSMPRTSIPASLPLKIEAVGLQNPKWDKTQKHQQRCLTMRRALIFSEAILLSRQRPKGL